jgi:2-polyprenyl-3-methyl-5-hydroxy-6-metoxy-1,4-benzoquinol methylase
MGVEERLTLEATSAHTLIATEHVHRYQLAAGVCEGARVLDLACGSGYGSRILRARAGSVTGVDNDETTIRAAQASVGQENDIQFIAADAASYLESPAASDFDVIVCFEGLEHLPEPGRALDALEVLAKAGKKIVFSVPNSKAFHEQNEFHVTDFGFEEAMAAFGRFDDHFVLYQFMAEGSLIRPDDASADLHARIELSEHGEKEYANHFICFVNCRPDEVTDGRMQLTAAPAYNRYVVNLERSMREMWQTNTRLARQRLGVDDSAAAAMVSRLQEAEHRAEVAKAESEQLKAWYDAPRYQVVDAFRTILVFTGIHWVAKQLGRLARRAIRR